MNDTSSVRHPRAATAADRWLSKMAILAIIISPCAGVARRGSADEVLLDIQMSLPRLDRLEATVALPGTS